MPTVTLQRPPTFGSMQAHRGVGRATGNAIVIDQLGRATVDTTDAPHMLANGWVYAFSLDGSQPSSGQTTIDFGAFPGTPETQAVVTAQDVSDPNAVLDVWILPLATTDHTADEHMADPPRVTAVNTTPGTSFTIYGFPSGRDLPVPPGTPFGNTANSQMPVAQTQLMPVGKWNVGWAFSP